jgi:transmembrane sensor
MQVQAVGTRFDVNLKKSGAIVTVLEGKVAVSSHALAVDGLEPIMPTKVEALLIAGEQAIITETAIARPKLANIAAATAWKQGELEFDETPLVEVAEEFNRYNRVRLIVESPSLDDLRISGVYSSDDPRSLIRFLHNQPDLVVTETKREIRIRQR